jgi:hypothetical protein
MTLTTDRVHSDSRAVALPVRAQQALVVAALGLLATLLPSGARAEQAPPAPPAPPAVTAPDAAPKPAGSVSVAASVDNFLGFNFQFSGAYALTPTIDVMLLGTVFTATQFGVNSTAVKNEDGTTRAASNNAYGLFVPVGPALRFKFFGGKLSATPFLEVANGGLLSGQRNSQNASHHTGALAEGLVPGLALAGKLDKLSASLKGAYFVPVRDLGPARVQLARVQASAAYRTGWVGVGAMFDWLGVVHKTDTPRFERYDDFLFVGPQLDLHFADRATLSMAGGPDFARTQAGTKNDGRSFYRVTIDTRF